MFNYGSTMIDDRLAAPLYASFVGVQLKFLLIINFTSSNVSIKDRISFGSLNGN